MKIDCPKKNGRYVNPHAPPSRSRPLDALLWFLGWHDDPEEIKPSPEGFAYPKMEKPLDPNAPKLQWIGHDTFLITYKSLNILTDPIWSWRCSPFQFVGPRRKHHPAISLEELPKIDFVLISHDHYDHLDKETVRRPFYQNPDIQWIVPRGVKRWFLKLSIRQVVELAWWEEALLHHTVPIKVTAVPAQHTSGRGLFDHNRSLWAGFVLELDQEKTLYFAGDTGYNTINFKQIGDHWKKIDLSLISIGSYAPRSFMRPVHVDPEGAIAIHNDVGSNLSVAMHWNTFNLANEPSHLPPYELFSALQAQNIDPAHFRVLDPGQQLNF